MTEHAGQPSAQRLRPCPFCGNLVAAAAERCESCQVALDQKTLLGVRRLVGPWHVWDEQIPTAPGVNWSKLQQLADRGSIKPTSVVRGPATYGLWQYAQDTPAVATLLGICWSCHASLSDRNARACSRCEVELNGPTDWAAPEQPAGETQVEAGLKDLAQAAVAAPAAQRAAPPPKSSARNVLVVVCGMLLVAAASVAVFWFAHGLGQDRRQETRTRDLVQENDFSQALPAGKAPPGKAGAGEADKPLELSKGGPSGSLPGELFPTVPFGTDKPPAESPKTPDKTPEKAPDKSPPTSQPAVAVATPEKVKPPPSNGKTTDSGNTVLATQLTATTKPKPGPQPVAKDDPAKRSALAMYVLARKCQSEGDLAAAATILQYLMAQPSRSALPKTCEQTLKDVQAQLTASRPAEPKSEELIKQWHSAQKLLEEAQALEKAGEVLGAQEKLLKVLNDHHPKAWPSGALDAYARILQLLKSGPPELFEEVAPK